MVCTQCQLLGCIPYIFLQAFCKHVSLLYQLTTRNISRSVGFSSNCEFDKVYLSPYNLKISLNSFFKFTFCHQNYINTTALNAFQVFPKAFCALNRNLELKSFFYIRSSKKGFEKRRKKIEGVSTPPFFPIFEKCRAKH